MTLDVSSRPLGLYIHWPFCVSKCPYCDFNSFVGQNINEDAYRRAYLAQIDYFYTQTPHHTLHTIFFGGGTPSLMPPGLTHALIQHAQNLWTCADHMEITLEANPNTVDRERFEHFKDAGINRLSIGIQSFHQESLTFLGRNHSVMDGVRAIDLACSIYHDRVTFDLIYARPDQTLKQWHEELTYALSFGTAHLSLYQLTIEPGTAFAPRYERGDIILPHEELSADLYRMTHDITAHHGLCDYEVSNYARPGYESQHNMIYWRYQDYVGIGPGAHGRFQNEKGEKIATVQHKAPELWLNQVLNQNTHGRMHSVTLAQQFKEWIMMGLRLKEGVCINTVWNEKFLNDPLWPTLQPKIRALVDEGYMHTAPTHMALTPEGRLRLNQIIGFLI